MLVVSGLVPFVWMILWLIFIDDGPEKAKWITKAERDYLARTLASEKEVRLPAGRDSYLRALFSPQVLLLVAMYFCFIFGSIGMLFWLPTALRKAAHGSNLFISVLYIVPFVVGAVAMVLNSLHSDKVRERRVHVAWALVGGGALFLAGTAVSGLSPMFSYVLICLAGIGSFAPLGPFWAIPSETLPKRTVGPAMGLINAVGSLGGYFGPLVVGYLVKRTGSFQVAFSVLAIALLIGGALSFLLERGSSAAAPERAARAGISTT
jgi:sugar phosphate permease